MKITCRTMDNKNITVEGSSDSTIKDLINLLNIEHAFDPLNISIIFGGKILDHSITLSSLDYKEDKWFVLFPKRLETKSSQTPTGAATATATATEAAPTAATAATTATAATEVTETQDNKTDRISVKLPNREIMLLQQIKGSLLKLIRDLPNALNDYQINTIVYDAYKAAEKDPDLALNMLLFRILGPLSEEQINILKEITKYDD